MLRKMVGQERSMVKPVGGGARLPPFPPRRHGSHGHPGSIKFPTQFDANVVNDVGTINSWLECMKVSSPTHAINAETLSPSMLEEHTTWRMNHPSALNMFEDILKNSKGKKIVMFLDYDGTLSPIVEDPDHAYMIQGMRDVVRKVAMYFPTAIVTGRRKNQIYSFVRLEELYYACCHGMDIQGPSYQGATNTVKFQAAKEMLPVIQQVYEHLVEKTKDIEGVKVENNEFCASVHFRCVDENKWTNLAKQVRSVLVDYPKLHLNHGRKVFELRPTIKWDKGKALEFLLESLGFDDSKDVLPIYIGDDRTDEDAFKVLKGRGQGFGILVSKFPKETNALYTLQDPFEVMEFLNCLVEWKCHN